MKVKKWILTQRAKRILLTIGIVLGAFIAIGIAPPVLFALLILGIGYGLFKVIMRMRRAQRGDTKTYE